jgi:hypothetical protein
MPMDIKTLYSLVTEAIRKAEAMEDLKAPGDRDAYLDVSLLEERIASLLPALGEEGAIARCGAVAAAIDAHDFARAAELAARYLAEDDTDISLKADLADLRRQVESAIDTRQNRSTPSVPAHNYSIVARFVPKSGNGHVSKQTFSSISELRRVLCASDTVASVRVEVNLKGRSTDELRQAVDEAFS